jgi:hypothetical protein
VEPGQTIHYDARLSHMLDLRKSGLNTIKTEKLDRSGNPALLQHIQHGP